MEIDRLEAKLKHRDELAAPSPGSVRRTALHAETGEDLGLLRGALKHDAAICAMVALPTTGQLAVGLDSGIVVVWDASSRAQLHAIETAGAPGSPIAAMAHEALLQLTATVREDGTVQIWDARWEEFGRIATPKGGDDRAPSSLALLPPHFGSAHGSVCVGFTDGTIMVWPLTADANPASVCTAAEDPGLLLEQATQALHRGRTTVPPAAVTRQDRADVASLSEDVVALRSSVDALLDAAGQLIPLVGLAAGVGGGTPRRRVGGKKRAGREDLQVLARAFGEVATITGQHEEGVATLLWVEQSETLVSGSYDTTLCVWKPRIAARPPPGSVGSKLSVASSASSGPSSGGRSVIWECTEVLGVEENDVLTQSVRSLCCINMSSHAAGVRGLSGADAGCVIASGHGDGRLKVWQVGVSSPIGEADGHFDDERDGAVTRVLSIANGSSAVSSYVASASEDGTVKLWKVASLLGTRAQVKGDARAVATLCREQASINTSKDVSGQMLSVEALALVYAGAVPILAVAAGEVIDLWQIAGI